MKTIEQIREEIRALILVEEETGCWRWHGRYDQKGIAMFKRTTAARATYEAFIGPIPEGKRLSGCVKNADCVYPEHRSHG